MLSNSFGVGSMAFFSDFEDGGCFGVCFLFLTIKLELLELHREEKLFLVQ